MFAATQAAEFDEGCEKIGLSSGGSIFQGNCSPHDPKLLTVATDMGGAFITYDGGAKWRTIHFTQLSGSCSAAAAFHPQNPDVIYWDNGGGELRVSRDRGATWTPVSSKPPWRGVIIRIWLDPDYPERIFVGTSEKQTCLSRDEGKTWTECASLPGGLLRVAVDRQSPADKRVYFAGTDRGFFRSDDDGQTFVKKTKGLAQDKLTGFAAGSNQKATLLYAAVPCELKDGNLAGGVFRSTDKGETWERCMHAKINQETKRADEYALGDLPQYGWMAARGRPPGAGLRILHRHQLSSAESCHSLPHGRRGQLLAGSAVLRPAL